jgi:Domain of unknown function (DUF4350)
VGGAFEPAGEAVSTHGAAGTVGGAWLGEAARRHGWLLACGCVLAVFVVLGLLSDSLAPAPQGPVSSSYATAPAGLAAWAELGARAGHPIVQLREPIDRARLEPSSTVVVLDPNALLRSEGLRLLAFVRAGGQLLIGGRYPEETLPALLPDSPAWSSGASPRDVPVAGGRVRGDAVGGDAVLGDAVLRGVGEVSSAGEGEWTETKGARTLLRTGSVGALLLGRRIGAGELYLLADASPLQNRRLAAADNAQLALNLAGPRGRPLVFVESLHGYGPSSGLAAIPARWWLAFAALALAGLLWILARARRLGPPERTPGSPPPPRAAYVDALALLLRRTGRERELASMFPSRPSPPSRPRERR